MKTSKGYAVSGYGPAYNPRLNSFSEFSGRVRVVADDPSQDEIVRWDSNNNPIDHDYGSLVLPTGAHDATVNGFNMFKGLVGGQSEKGEIS